MSINLIACVDEALGLGYQNKLLTHLPNDLKHFKHLTKGKICVQGRNTYESIMEYNGTPLKNRTNIVLTSDYEYDAHPSVFIYNTVKDVLHEYYNYGEQKPEVFICGGEQVYKHFLSVADNIYLTEIHHKFNDVDAYFPKFLHDTRWELESEEHHFKDEKHEYDYTFKKYSIK